MIAPSSLIKKDSRERFQSIQALRGIAAMLVVLVHLYVVEVKYYTTHFLRPFRFGWIGVDIFFVISGIVISMVTENKFQSVQNAVMFLYRRFARIWPIYWFYYGLCLVVYLRRPDLFNASEGHHADLIRSFFLIPSQYRNIVGQAGSLTYELYFYTVFFALMLITSSRNVIYWLAGWAAAVIGIYFICPVSSNHIIIMTVANPLVFEFLAGYLAYYLYRRYVFPRWVGPTLMALSIVWMVVLITWTTLAGGANMELSIGDFWRRPLGCGFFAFLLVFGAMLGERSGWLRVGIHLKALGDWSYSIYLCHLIIMEVIGRGLSNWLGHSWIGIPATVALSIPAVIFVGYLSYTYLEHPLILYTHKRM
jgi:peptidoglycan/LPS O-acetylase OafA/YrhL